MPDPLPNNRPVPADREKVLARAFLEMKNLQAKVQEFERARSEPIAIVGMACRFPGGVADQEAFWRLLRDGVDATSDVPADRWDAARYFDPDPETPENKMYTRRGAFVDRVRDFDAAFFSITPREAAAMDPQQRLLLEVAWEALENAGIAADGLAGTPAGVFVGMCGFDYAQLLLADKRIPIDGYMGSGSTHSAAAGRLSYFLGLRGPCLAVDTACSSSLVSVHLACKSLRDGESGIALAGGVNLILIPETTIIFSKARMMSPDGRCKTFDAAADGYVRGEGCGMLVLKRLSDAQRDGDSILALIRGSAVNQDGRSSGLTVPNGTAQEEVLRAALRNAGVSPAQIGYVEAHGTGTKLGDPIELHALGAVLSEGRSQPFIVGSVKTNIGHLEGAAGVAGLMKVVLALGHREIPGHLHFHEPNPFIDWDRLPVVVPTRTTAWNAIEGRRLAGVSSFGFSGTNAHIVLEEAPSAPPQSDATDRPVHVLAISAKTAPALSDLAVHYRKHLLTTSDAAGDVCYSANTGRSHFAHRLAVVGEDNAELAGKLADAAPPVRAGRPRIAFLFTGQGSQYHGMARALYETSPVFREQLDRAGPDIVNTIYGADTGLLDQTGHTQPCLFAIECALAELWRSWGITPAFVMGHSVGEFAAAASAGVFSFEDGLRLVTRRAALMQQLPGGGMLSVAAPGEQVAAAMEGQENLVSIAAINGPASTVVSGDPGALARIADAFARSQPLRVSHAFHSPSMDAVVSRIDDAAREISFAPPRVPLVSNLTGGFVSDRELGAPEYWGRHARQTVQFERGMTALRAKGADVFLEIGPHPVLLGMGRNCVAGNATWLGSLRRGVEDWRQLGESLAALYTLGATVDWRGFDAGRSRRKVFLPTYAFQRESHWREASHVAAGGGSDTLSLTRVYSPLFEDRAVFECLLSADSPSFLGEHRLAGKPVLPAAACVTMALAAAPESALENLTLQEPITFEPGEPRRIQLVLQAGKLRIFSADERATAWKLHAEAELSPGSGSPPRFDAIEFVQRQCAQGEPVAPLYAGLAARGLMLGTVFRSVAGLWRGVGEAVGEIRLAAELVPGAMEYCMHPVLLDGCLQVAGSIAAGDGQLRVPARFGRVRIFSRTSPIRVWCHATAERILVADDRGMVVAEIEGIEFRPLPALAASPLYDVVWEPRPTSTSLMPPREALDRLRNDAASVNREFGLDVYDALLPQLEEISVAAIAGAFQELGVGFQVAARHRRLVARMIEILEEAEYVATDAESPGPRLQALIARYPGRVELSLLERCISNLTQVLRGEVDPLDVLFPGGSMDLLEATYRDSAFARASNALVERFLAAVGSASGDRAIRVLELGAGTGSTTASALAVLPKDRTDYLFTDLSPVFTARGASQFGVRSQILDIEKDPAAQGLGSQQFDIVLAANVLHATADLRRSLRHARSLLAPGGLLVLVESSGRQRWVDLIFGLTEGWWKFGDLDLRPSYPLLPEQTWVELLASEGFEDVRTIGVRESRPGRPNQSLIVARKAVKASKPGNWLILADRAGFGRRLAEAVDARGGRAVTAMPGEDVRALVDSWPAIDKVVHLWSLDGGEVADAAFEACGSTLHLVQALAARPAPSQLCLVVNSAQSIASATLWGMGKVIALEHPELRCLRVDLESETPVSALLDLDWSGPEDQVAIRDGVPHVPRLRPARLPVSDRKVALRGEATYLITGGLGDLGLEVARWMVSRGARKLLLIGRSEPSAAAQTALASLRSAGAHVVTACVDVTRPAELAVCLQQAAATMPPIRGVVHSAGVLSDGYLVQQSVEGFREVLAPKVVGAWQLHLLTRGLPLDFFVLFSSAAGLLGSPTQANHAAANTFLDALAHHRHGLGLPSLAIDWGIWRDVGYAARVHADTASRRYGMDTISATQGIEIFEQLLQSPGTVQMGVLPVDWDQFLSAFPKPIPPFFDGMARAYVAPGSSAPAQTVDFAARVKEARPGERRPLCLEYVRQAAARVIRLKSPDTLDPRQPLNEMGLDSLMAVELRNELETVAGAGLPSTLLFDYPTIESLAEFTAGRIAPEAPSPRGEAVDQALLEQVRDLSPEAVEADLLRELESLEY